jgi:shikimate kinase
MTPQPVAVLVGAPGAGKTTVGRELAEHLGVDFIDVDAVIAQESGKSIPDIFIEDGEAQFRRLEKDAVLMILGEASGVVSLGGGAVIDPEVRAALADHRVVWLRVSAAQAASRVGLTGARPLLMGNVRGTLIALLEERTPLYDEVAQIVVDTDDRSIADIVADIVANLEGA